MIYSNLKDSAFTKVKRDAKFLTRYMKGVPFVNRRYEKLRGTFSVKNGILKGKGWSSEPREPPHLRLCFPPIPPRHGSTKARVNVN